MRNEDRLFAIADEVRLKPTSSLSPARQIFKIVWELEAEVNNGGFNQYFVNSSGRNAPRAEAALRAIHANSCAGLVARAFKTVEASKIDWANDAKRQSQLDRLAKRVGGKLEMLDEKFFEYPDPLSELLANFVTAHLDEFRFRQPASGFFSTASRS